MPDTGHPLSRKSETPPELTLAEIRANLHTMIDQLEREAAPGLAAERDRLREALGKIAQGAGNGRPALDAAEARNIAREALDA